MSNKLVNSLMMLFVAGTVLTTSATADTTWGQGREHGMGMGDGGWGSHSQMMGDPSAHGMMGSGMMGPGMMMGGSEAVWSLNLSDQQRKQIRDIYRDLRKKHGDIRDQIDDESDKLWDLYGQDKRDVAAIGKVYDKIFSLRRQMIEQSLEVHNKVSDVLTKEQREEWKRRSAQWRWSR